MNKKILDVCCGGRMFRFDKKNPNVDFMDIRKEIPGFIPARPNFEISPDIIGDFRCLPFGDSKYKLVIFDPPHLKIAGPKSYMAGKYGKLSKDRQEDIRKGFDECRRVLENNGILIFKRNETQIRIVDVLKCISEKPLFGTRSGRDNKTMRFCFMKIV